MDVYEEYITVPLGDLSAYSQSGTSKVEFPIYFTGGKSRNMTINLCFYTSNGE